MNTRLFPGLTALCFSLRAACRGQRPVRVAISGEGASDPVPVTFVRPVSAPADRSVPVPAGKAA